MAPTEVMAGPIGLTPQREPTMSRIPMPVSVADDLEQLGLRLDVIDAQGGAIAEPAVLNTRINGATDIFKTDIDVPVVEARQAA